MDSSTSKVNATPSASSASRSCPVPSCGFSIPSAIYDTEIDAHFFTRHADQLLSTADKRPFPCPHAPSCPATFNYPPALKLHLKLYCKVEKPLKGIPLQPYPCPEPHCIREFDYEESLIQHLRKKHSNKCPSCTKKFLSESTLAEHVKKCHPLSSAIAPGGPSKRNLVYEGTFKCSDCQEGFKSQYLLKAHKLGHWKGTGTFAECDICHAGFKSGGDVAIHKCRAHKMVTKWKCETCQEVFESVEGINQHEKCHDENEQFVEMKDPLCLRSDGGNGQIKTKVECNDNECDMENQMGMGEADVKMEDSLILDNNEDEDPENADGIPFKKHKFITTNSAFKTCPVPSCGFAIPSAIYDTEVDAHFFTHHPDQLLSAADKRPLLCPHAPSCPATFNYPPALKLHVKFYCKVEKTLKGILVKPYPCPEPQCILQNLEFDYEVSLIQHLRNIHNAGCRRWKCPDCAETFLKERTLTEHVRQTHSVSSAIAPDSDGPFNAPKRNLAGVCEGTYKCTDCEESFKSQNSLKGHKSRHWNRLGKGESAVCDICHAGFKSVSDVGVHKCRAHKMVLEWKCEICQDIFDSVEGLNQHKKDHDENEHFVEMGRMKDLDADEEMKDPLCLSSDSSYGRNSGNGQITIEVECNDNECDVENQAEMEKADVKMEDTIIPDNNEDENPENSDGILFKRPKFTTTSSASFKTCPVPSCGFQIPSAIYETEVDAHFFTHHADQLLSTADKRPFPCPRAPSCPDTFNYPSALKLHVKLYCKVEKTLKGILLKPHPCPYPQCILQNLEFDYEGSLTRHLRNKHNAGGWKRWKCPASPSCTKMFHRESTLSQHVRKHHPLSFVITVPRDPSKHNLVDEGTFKCRDCQECFKSQNSLNAHKRKHWNHWNGLATFVECEICHGGFKSVGDVAIHKRRTHETIVKWKCEICQEFFESVGELSKHVAKGHEENEDFVEMGRIKDVDADQDMKDPLDDGNGQVKIKVECNNDNWYWYGLENLVEMGEADVKIEETIIIDDNEEEEDAVPSKKAKFTTTTSTSTSNRNQLQVKLENDPEALSEESKNNNDDTTVRIKLEIADTGTENGSTSVLLEEDYAAAPINMEIDGDKSTANGIISAVPKPSTVIISTTTSSSKQSYKICPVPSCGHEIFGPIYETEIEAHFFTEHTQEILSPASATKASFPCTNSPPCPLSFAYLPALKLHLKFYCKVEKRIRKGPSFPYRCSEPNCLKLYKLKSQEELEEHLLKHSQQLKCPGCPDVFFESAELSTHLAKDHPFSFVTSVSTESDEVRDKYEPNGTLICPNCKDRFTTWGLFRKHRAGHSRVGVECEVCKAVFKSSMLLAEHKQKMYGMVIKWKCEICQEVFESVEGLSRHVEKGHDENENVMEGMKEFDADQEMKDPLCLSSDGSDKIKVKVECNNNGRDVENHSVEMGGGADVKMEDSIIPDPDNNEEKEDSVPSKKPKFTTTTSKRSHLKVKLESDPEASKSKDNNKNSTVTIKPEIDDPRTENGSTTDVLDEDCTDVPINMEIVDDGVKLVANENISEVPQPSTVITSTSTASSSKHAFKTCPVPSCGHDIFDPIYETEIDAHFFTEHTQEILFPSSALFPCPNAPSCPLAFAYSSALKLHLKFYCKVSNVENLTLQGITYRCPEPNCTSTFKKENDLKTHLIKHSQQLQCPGCPEFFSGSTGSKKLSTHLTKNHPFSFVVNVASAEIKAKHVPYGSLKCQQCKEKFTSRLLFRKHKTYHSQVGVECDVCKAVFNSSKSLAEHRQKMYGMDLKWKCEICEKILDSVKELADHVEQNHAKNDQNQNDTHFVEVDGGAILKIEDESEPQCGNDENLQSLSNLSIKIEILENKF